MRLSKYSPRAEVHGSIIEATNFGMCSEGEGEPSGFVDFRIVPPAELAEERRKAKAEETAEKAEVKAEAKAEAAKHPHSQPAHHTKHGK